MENNLNLVSKLLANENITVQRGNFKTASFDIVNRVLRLPTLIGMTETEEFLMIFHEVGHALFTPTEYCEKVKESREKKMRGYGQYLNIVEDVRIERKIKDMYPGSRRDFFQGYKSLNDRDFFGTKGKDMSSYSFIDRLNLFYKSGMACGVKFTSDEAVFVRRCEQVETFDDVVALTDEIYAFAANQGKQEKQKQEEMYKQIPTDEEDEGDDYDDDSDGDDTDEYDSDDYEDSDDVNGDPEDSDEESEETDEEPESGNTSEGNEESESEEDPLPDAPLPETQQKFDDKLGGATATDDVAFIDFKVSSTYYIVSFEEFAAQQKKDEWKVGADISSIRASIKRSAGYLFREFQMRKSAARYARQSTSKSGALNIKRLAQYKTTDDMFKKYNIVPDDQSHGMVVLLDFSGSMSRTIRFALLELYTLATFCNMAKIPFKFYAFVQNYGYIKPIGKAHNFGVDQYNTSTLKSGIFGMNMSMVEIGSSSASFKDFEKTMKLMYYGDFGMYRMTNTPLDEALIILDEILPKFKVSARVDKVSLVTITDGGATGTSYISNGAEYSGDRHSKSKLYFVDEVNNRKHALNKFISTDVITQMLKDRHHYLTIVGYFVVQDLDNRGVDSFVRTYSRCVAKPDEEWMITRKRLMLMRKDNVITVAIPGYDIFNVFAGNTIGSDFNIVGLTSKSTIAATAKAFAQGMSNGIKNKVVLSTLVETIA